MDWCSLTSGSPWDIGCSHCSSERFARRQPRASYFCATSRGWRRRRPDATAGATPECRREGERSVGERKRGGYSRWVGRISFFVARHTDEDHEKDCDDSDSGHGFLVAPGLRAPFERFVFQVTSAGQLFEQIGADLCRVEAGQLVPHGLGACRICRCSEYGLAPRRGFASPSG